MRSATPPETKPLTRRETDELLAFWDVNEPIQAQLPIRFENGTCLDRYGGKCGRCGLDIADVDFRGRVSRPIEAVAVIEAAGACHECRIVTRYTHRLRDGLTLEWISADGTWRSQRVPPPSPLWGFVLRLAHWIRAFVRRACIR